MQQSLGSSSVTSSSWRSSCAWEVSDIYSKTSKRCSWRGWRRSDRSTSEMRKGENCETRSLLICERWVRFFHSLLNAKLDMLDPTPRRGSCSNMSQLPSEPSSPRRKLPLRIKQRQTRKQRGRTVFLWNC